MQPAPRAYDQGQLSKNEFTEIEKVIKNYRIIVDHVNTIDTDYKGKMTRSLLNAIFGYYIPKIEEFISGRRGQKEHSG